MKHVIKSAVAILALALPGAILANVTGNNVTVNSAATLSFETGTSSGTQDILYNGTGIQFQGSAKGLNLTTFGLSGASGFSTITSGGSSILSSFPLSGATITSLTAGTIIAYKTNAGNTGALLINTVSAASISINFVTFETGTGGGGGPTITAVLNNYGLQPPGFTNSGIAPGTLFIIKGANLSTTSQFVLQDPAPGLPTTLNGATVKISTTGTAPGFYYAGSTQLALVLPSDTPAGAATVTVTVNGQASNAFSITVVANNFGMLSADQTGTGSVKAVNPNNPGNPYISFTNSAPPGQIISIYGTGLGGDSARDLKFVQPTGAQISGLSAFYVGGMQVQIQYQGASGYPGLNQVNIVLPANVQTGCFVSIVGVNPQGVPTNFLTMPIGNGTCQDPGLGFSNSLISGISGKNTLNVGTVGLIYDVSGTQAPFIEADAAFIQYSNLFSAANTQLTLGGCITTETVVSGNFNLPTGLGAGTITMTSPNTGAIQLVNAGIAGFYTSDDPKTGISLLPAGFLTQSGGTFPVVATAGTQVGAFNTSITFPNPLLVWTNQSSITSVTRSAGVTVTWSGGAPGTYVYITGNASTGAGAGATSGSFTCVAPVEAKTFTVPPYVLGILPAGTGTLSLGNSTVPATFTATGLDYGYASGIVELDNDKLPYK